MCFLLFRFLKPSELTLLFRGIICGWKILTLTTVYQTFSEAFVLCTPFLEKLLFTVVGKLPCPFCGKIFSILFSPDPVEAVAYF